MLRWKFLWKQTFHEEISLSICHIRFCGFGFLDSPPRDFLHASLRLFFQYRAASKILRLRTFTCMVVVKNNRYVTKLEKRRVITTHIEIQGSVYRLLTEVGKTIMSHHVIVFKDRPGHACKSPLLQKDLDVEVPILRIARLLLMPAIMPLMRFLR